MLYSLFRFKDLGIKGDVTKSSCKGFMQLEIKPQGDLVMCVASVGWYYYSPCLCVEIYLKIRSFIRNLNCDCLAMNFECQNLTSTFGRLCLIFSQWKVLSDYLSRLIESNTDSISLPLIHS